MSEQGKQVQLTSANGEPLTSETIIQKMHEQDNSNTGIAKIKASDRTRSKNLTEHHRDFRSKDDMEESAKRLYAQAEDKIKKEYESDVAQGFDIKNPNSVNTFSVKYTPIGNTVLVKVLHDELKEGSLYLINENTKGKRAVVITPGLLATTLKKGDVVALKPTQDGQLMGMEHKFAGVIFHEIDYHAISGVMEFENVMQDRLKEMWAQYKSNNA